jgi:hypothetical protein
MLSSKFTKLAILGIALNAGWALADKFPEVPESTVIEDNIGFIVEGPNDPNLIGMTFEVTNALGEVLISKQSMGEQIVFDPNQSLPDGVYTYVIETTIGAPPELRGKMPGNTDLMTRTQRATFRVVNGRKADVEQANDVADRPQANMQRETPNYLIAAVGKLLDFVISDAAAANVTTAPDGDMYLQDDSPNFIFEYGPSPSLDDGTWIWWFRADRKAGVGSAGLTADFEIFDYTNSQYPFIIEKGSSTEKAIHIKSNGDIQFNNGAAAFDYSANSLVLGATSSSTSIYDLHIENSTPYIYMNDTTDGTYGGLFIWDTTDSLVLEGANGFQDVFAFSLRAPHGSMVLNSTGTFSVGNKIHVGSTSEPVGQFTITSAAQPRFELNDTTLNKRWRFSVAGDKFAINQLDFAGTEFQIFDNGDMSILGALTQNSDVNAKQDIVQVDPSDVLARIVALPISEWSYIDAPDQRHIGPMAQDFHAAFGLGRNEKQIATLDTSGVALAGIKALKAENDRLGAENRALRSELETQQARLATLEDRQTQIVATLSILTEADKPLLTSFVQEK